MKPPEPTRLVSLLALACACGLGSSCQRADPQAAPPTTSAPQPSAAPVALPTPVSAAVVASAAPEPPPSAAPPSAPAVLAPPSRVLVLGDSLADEAVGGGGFVKYLREKCPGVVFDNRAKGGFMVNQMRKRLETDVLPESQSYSHAIVFGGVNDLYSDQTASRTLERIERDLSTIYAALRQRSIQVVAITVTPWGGFKRWFSPVRGQNTLTLNAWIVAQAQQHAVAVTVDAYPLLSCGDSERLCPELSAPHKDGLHFGKLGHQKLGQAVLEAAFPGCKVP